MNEEKQLRINYEVISQILEAEKSKPFSERLKLKDLLAMNADCDPFYAGRESRKILAEWFEGIFDKFGVSGMHLRRLHYKIIDQAKTPNIKPFYGRVYQNTKKEWKILNNASAQARHLGLVSYDDFVDRRNPPPKVTMEHSTEPLYDLRSSVTGVEVTEGTCPNAYLDFNEMQLHPYHVEIWAEKSTMDDILVPLCEKYRVFLMTGAGFESLTHINDLIRRLQSFNKPCRIFYINDYDFAGQNMPRQLGTQLAFRRQKEGLLDQLDVRIRPIILLKEQVKQYQLPGAPDKKQTELDALEALHPGVFEEIVKSHLLKYINLKVIEEIESHLERARKHWEGKMVFAVLGKFEEELKDLYNKTDGLCERIRKVVNQVEKPKLDLPSLPEIAEKEDWFFDSKRDYFQQLKKYKSFESEQQPGDQE